MVTNKKAGFTIVEVLMFLAISAALFTIAFFGTRNTQDNVAFRDSLNSTEAKLREVFNNVDNGYFANAGQYDCDGTSINDVVGTGGGNSSCLFIGKHISFIDDNTMHIDTIITNRIGPPVAITTLPSGLKEDYHYFGSVLYSGATTLQIRSILDAESLGDSDTRAVKQILVGTNWETINNINKPYLCFEHGGRKGAIVVEQNDISVNYAYSGIECI